MTPITLEAEGCPHCGRSPIPPLRIEKILPRPAVRRMSRIVGIILAILLPSTPCLSVLAASREDSARLVFQKTAGGRETHVHVVKKGEWIAGIFRSQRGDEPVPYALIRHLNPGIRDLNRIRAGQRIVLPVRAYTDPDAAPPVPDEKGEPTATYRIREGDSISRILIEEFQVHPEDTLRTYRLVRRLNPEIADPNLLPVGQDLKLPPDLARRAPAAARPVPSAALPAEPRPTELLETVVLTLENPAGEAVLRPPTVEAMLTIIRPVISRMKGSVTAAGNYFIPLKDAAQVTIDCSLLPVVELDDGSTVLLDFGNRLSDNLKGVIRQSWPHYAFIAAAALPDQLTALQAIIAQSRNYTMIRGDRPLALTQKPEMLVFPDWIIAAKRAVGGTLFRQGIFLLEDAEKPLLAQARNLIENNGLAVTEIAEGHAVMSLPLPPAPPPAVADLRGLKGIALAEQLLKLLGETPVPAAEVVLFDQAKDGFNLAVTADLLLRKGDKRFILLKKNLPEQFIRILREGGTEVITVAETDSGRTAIEAVLKGIGIPVSLGYFSFRIPDDAGRPRLMVAFPALRTTAAGEPLYLVDFDIPADLLSLLRERKTGLLAKY